MCKRCSKHAGGSMRLTKMITAVDTHAAGEPGRVIIGGVLP